MSKIAVDRAHSWAWAMADVKVSLPLCPARMLNACGICAKLELICVRLVLRMCVRVSGSERLHDVGVTGVLGAGFIYRRSRRGAGTLRDRGGPLARRSTSTSSSDSRWILRRVPAPGTGHRTCPFGAPPGTPQSNAPRSTRAFGLFQFSWRVRLFRHRYTWYEPWWVV